MDYTTLANVKLEMAINEAKDDTLIAKQVTNASRAIDRMMTGREDVTDYFKTETISNEILAGYRNPLIDNNGHLMAWPHKPIITAVSALSFRMDPRQGWQSLDPGSLVISNGKAVEGWTSFERGRIMVQVSYTGGLGTLSTTNGVTTSTLPDDLVEAATVLAARFYKEAQGGLTDSVGVAELGMIMYTKALPVRFTEMLTKYLRVQPW